MERTKERQIIYCLIFALLIFGVKTIEAQNTSKGIDNPSGVLSQKIEGSKSY